MFPKSARRLKRLLVFVSLGLLLVSLSPDIRLCSYAYAEPKISQGSIDILSKTGQAIAEIVDEVKPAIVNISSSKTIKTQQDLTRLMILSSGVLGDESFSCAKRTQSIILAQA
jgi:S1-C subfamily serine protease